MSTRLVCARCAKSMTDYREVGYDGPIPIIKRVRL